MTDELNQEIKIKAKQVTEDLISFMQDLDTENNYKIKELEYDIEYYKSCIEELKENAIQWHDLRKDPNDLPPMIQDERRISERVWISVENWGTEDGHYDYNKNCWIIRCRIVNLPILGWCEIPQFD